jgi:hypothetical protein
MDINQASMASGGAVLIMLICASNPTLVQEQHWPDNSPADAPVFTCIRIA